MAQLLIKIYSSEPDKIKDYRAICEVQELFRQTHNETRILFVINQRPPAGPFEGPSSNPQLCWWSLIGPKTQTRLGSTMSTFVKDLSNGLSKFLNHNGFQDKLPDSQGSGFYFVHLFAKTRADYNRGPRFELHDLSG